MSSLMAAQSADLAELLRNVWLSFLDEELVEIDEQHGYFTEAAVMPPAGQMLASISIDGAWNGWFHLSTSQECADAVAAAMFQMDVAEISSEEAIDALGELTNIVGGNIKSMLAAPSSLSLPQVSIDRQAPWQSEGVLGPVSVMHWHTHTIVASLWEAVSSVGVEF